MIKKASKLVSEHKYVFDLKYDVPGSWIVLVYHCEYCGHVKTEKLSKLV